MQEEEIKKKKLTDELILNIKNPMETLKQLLELTSEFRKL